VGDVDLDQILCHIEERAVGQDNVVTLDTVALQIAKQPGRRTCTGLRVSVRRHLNGQHSVWHGTRCLGGFDAHGRALSGPARPRPKNACAHLPDKPRSRRRPLLARHSGLHGSAAGRVCRSAPRTNEAARGRSRARGEGTGLIIRLGGLRRVWILAGGQGTAQTHDSFFSFSIASRNRTKGRKKRGRSPRTAPLERTDHLSKPSRHFTCQQQRAAAAHGPRRFHARRPRRSHPLGDHKKGGVCPDESGVGAWKVRGSRRPGRGPASAIIRPRVCQG
jgi:hypothetical protein